MKNVPAVIYEGILWYLKRQQPSLRYLTISSVYQEDISSLLPEHIGNGDFILVVPKSMTKTF